MFPQNKKTSFRVLYTYIVAGWYLSKNGTDTPDCGKHEETPCGSLHWLLDMCCSKRPPGDSTLHITSDTSLQIDKQTQVRKLPGEFISPHLVKRFDTWVLIFRTLQTYNGSIRSTTRVAQRDE